MNQTVRASFSHDRGGILSSYVKLEQVGEVTLKGLVTKTQLAQGLQVALFGGYPPVGDCGTELEGGEVYFDAVIHAYYSPAGLNFTFGVTHGSASGAIHRVIKVEERVKFELTNSAQVRYGISSLVSIKWEGDTWDSKGRVVHNPPLVLDENDLIANQKLYGTAIVTYYTRRVEYKIKILARGDVPENLFQSVAYAKWDGGVDLLSINAPIGASQDTINQVQCYTRTGSTEVTGNEDDDDTPQGNSSDITCDVLYCELKKKDEDCGSSQ